MVYVLIFLSAFVFELTGDSWTRLEECSEDSSGGSLKCKVSHPGVYTVGLAAWSSPMLDSGGTTDSTLSGGAIAGIVIGVVAAVAIAAAVAFVLIKRGTFQRSPAAATSAPATAPTVETSAA